MHGLLKGWPRHSMCQCPGHTQGPAGEAISEDPSAPDRRPGDDTSDFTLGVVGPAGGHFPGFPGLPALRAACCCKTLRECAPDLNCAQGSWRIPQGT